MRLVVVMTAVLGLTAGCVVEGQTSSDGPASNDASVLLDLGPVGDLRLRPDASDAASPTDAQRVSDMAVLEDAWVADYPGFIAEPPKATPVFVDLAVPFSGGDEAYAADLNGDGKMDVLTSNGSILLGNGDGTFQADRPIPMKPAYPIGAADFNHDGKADPVLVTYAKGYAGSFAVLLSHLP